MLWSVQCTLVPHYRLFPADNRQRSRNHLIFDVSKRFYAHSQAFLLDAKGDFSRRLVKYPSREVWGCHTQEGEPLENALRRFKRKVQQEDIIKEVKRHSFYLKPGERKRVKEALARKRNRKKARKEQD
jgi:small subunit ribosomal protein S21